MQQNFGRALCAGLGALYMAGAAPLFTFGETGQQLWAWIQGTVAPVASMVGIAPWMLTSALAPFAVAGPLALVWTIAGSQINRIYWFLAGVAGYGSGWWLLLRG